MGPAAESSSSNLLLYVAIGVGIVLVLVALGLAVWMSQRREGRPQGFTPQHGMPPGQPVPQSMPAGWYPDPGQQGRLRWLDGNRWTPDIQH